jgi:hypothetical protein
MVLNRFKPEISKIRVLILSCPKTGNVWLRSLFGYAYGVGVVEFPLAWTKEFAGTLPDEFIAHQHLHPSEEMVKWLIAEQVQVFTTVRHPGDTLVSLFHFVKWNKGLVDVTTDKLRAEKEPGAETINYIEHVFPKSYSLSKVWPALGSIPVKYEDLLANPLQQLRDLCARIRPVAEETLKAAVLMCRPELFNKGNVDARHVRAATSYQWVEALSEPILARMKRIEPYRSICRAYEYDWVDRRDEFQVFDYSSIDPFRGLDYFDNGEKIGYVIKKYYFIDVKYSQSRWPDPVKTGPGSFWNWLTESCLDNVNHSAYPEHTYTNLMKIIHTTREDLQAVFPDPVGANRIAFVDWFIDRALLESDMPWGLIAPAQDALMRHFVTASSDIQSG